MTINLRTHLSTDTERTMNHTTSRTFPIAGRHARALGAQGLTALLPANRQERVRCGRAVRPLAASFRHDEALDHRRPHLCLRPQPRHRSFKFVHRHPCGVTPDDR